MSYTIPDVIGGYDNWRPDRRTPTWFLCGDSTMANYPASAYPMMGWGQSLQSLLPGDVYVENCAVNGRSSKSFIAEKRLNFIELCLRKGDKLIISFSHNDEKPDPARNTNPRVTFPEYLSMYIDAARRQGAEPILVTPIARRHFSESGQLIPTHGPYPDAMRNLADYRGVRLIDLEKATMQMVQSAGMENSKRIYCHVPAGSKNYPDGLSDNSHLQEEGASRIAGLFLSRMKASDVKEADFETVEEGDYSDLIAREDSVLC
jgi:lysophospholipase L1-like esterase